MDSPGSYRFQGSQESLYDEAHHFFTPPVSRPHNHVFFNSDDSLYKTELRKLNIPVFKLEVTDFSEPSPRNVTFECDPDADEADYYENELRNSWKNKSSNFFMQKSQSFDVPSIQVELVNDTENYLNIASNKLSKPIVYSSLQDLSSSTSSINSGIHESNLDLSSIDPDTPVKHKNWKSPDEIRKGHVKSLTRHFEDTFTGRGSISKSVSTPNVNRGEPKAEMTQRAFFSEEKLNNKLTEIERLEVLKLLHDWSTQGSEAKDSTFSLKKSSVKFASEPNLSPKSAGKYNIFVTRYSSESNVTNDDFLHKCKFRNCIFNTDFKPTNFGTNKPKGILKPPTQSENECLNNITNLQHEQRKNDRRHSEIIETISNLNPQLIRCDSLERLTDLQKKRTVRSVKKFPESYIVRRAVKNAENVYRSPSKSAKVIVFRKKSMPKTWRSCSDIKYKQKTVRKCCKNAKKSCPVYKNSDSENTEQRRAQSCLNIDQENLDSSSRVDLKQTARSCSKK